MSAVLRLYRLDLTCPGVGCKHKPAIRVTEAVRDLVAPAEPDVVLATTTCRWHDPHLVYEIRAKHVHAAVFVGTRPTSGLLLDVGDLCFEVEPDIKPAGVAAVLSPRQLQVYMAVVEGKTDARIARELELSPWTVRQHMEEAATRLRVRVPSLPGASPRRTLLAHFAGSAQAVA